jgi:hypothetical protein
MAKTDLCRKLHEITDNVWWYEENSGISIYVDVSHDGIRDVKEVHIKWGTLRAALTRKARHCSKEQCMLQLIERICGNGP